MEQIYETDRLVLKVLNESASGIIADYYVRNRGFLQEWEIIHEEEYFTAEYQVKELAKDLKRIEDGSMLKYWIFEKGQLDRVIGMIAFNNIVRGAFLSCHLGYKLDKDEINKGYITEAIRKGIGIVFEEYGLHRIEANIMPKNKPSLRVAEKLGFYNEGLAYQYLKIHGKWEDHIHMVLLNDQV